MGINAKSQKRIESIQLIRAFSAITISLSHIPFTSINGWNIVFGVDIFLVLTGFLEMYVLDSHDSIDLKKFFLRKGIRILPLYWLITVLTFIVANIFTGAFGDTPTVSELVKSMLLIPYTKTSTITETVVVRPIIGPAHTLMYDAYFYVVYGIASRINMKKRGLIASAIILLVFLCGRLFFADNLFMAFYSNYWVIDFIFGILLYSVYKYVKQNGDKIRQVLNRRFVSVRVLSLIGSIGCVIVFFLVSRISVRGSSFIVLKCLPAFLFVLSVMMLFENGSIPKGLIRIGDISYSYYLIHYYFLVAAQMVFGSFSSFSFGNLVFAFMALVLAELAAYPLWLFVEQRFGNYLRKTIL